MSKLSLCVRPESKEDRATRPVPITLGFKAKEPLGMNVEAKMMTQATEKWTLEKVQYIYSR